MKKFILLVLAIIPGVISYCQKVTPKLKFDQGQTLEVVLDVKSSIAQQAGGQSFDFSVVASGTHTYKVTNATEDNSTLHHEAKRITFSFDGMGQKRNFDSNVEKDMNGQFGKPVRELLDKKFDIIIDQAGQVLLVQPEKVELTKMDDRLAIITSMMKDVMDIVQPPRKGSASFFKILPDREVGKGDSWSDTLFNENVKSLTNYTISDISDTTIVVDLSGSSVTVTKAELMGSETTTTMNNKTTGKIFVDRTTFLIKRKELVTESNGTAEIPAFGSLPVTSKTTMSVTLNKKTE